MLKVSGFTVSPVETESVLLAHPSVADCAVYGIPHDSRGEVPRAAVMIRPDQEVTGEELVRWVADRWPPTSTSPTFDSSSTSRGRPQERCYAAFSRTKTMRLRMPR
jgi:acyl-CoA synthetase (AMP-forming)/AMP-acid ligase II